VKVLVVVFLTALIVMSSVTSVWGHFTVVVSNSMEVATLGEGSSEEHAAEMVGEGQLQSLLGVRPHCW
jgi:hypothetical protein